MNNTELNEKEEIGFKEPQANVREAKDNLCQTTRKAGYFVWKFLVGVCQLLWECFSWLAYKRMRIPRLSLGIEALVFFVPALILVIYFQSKAVRAEDKMGVRHYELEQVYTDSLVRVEFSGYLRGKRAVLDSLREAKEREDMAKRERIFKYQQQQKNATNSDSAIITK